MQGLGIKDVLFFTHTIFSVQLKKKSKFFQDFKALLLTIKEKKNTVVFMIIKCTSTSY